VSNTPDQRTFIEALLRERDELSQERSKLRQADGGTLERYDALFREKDRKISQLDDKVKRSDEKKQKFEEKIKQLTDQLAWFRRKFWKPSSEKYIPSDPAQRMLDFDGLDILPEEETVIKASAQEHHL